MKKLKFDKEEKKKEIPLDLLGREIHVDDNVAVFVGTYRGSKRVTFGKITALKSKVTIEFKINNLYVNTANIKNVLLINNEIMSIENEKNNI